MTWNFFHPIVFPVSLVNCFCFKVNDWNLVLIFMYLILHSYKLVTIIENNMLVIKTTVDS